VIVAGVARLEIANPTIAGWLLFDLDPDYDVDLRDLAIWQNAFTGD